MNAEEALRRAFQAQAQRIQPSSDALATIQHRIGQRARLTRRITVGLASISSAAVATATAVIVGVVSCAPSPSTPTPPPGGTTSPATTTAPTSPAPGTGTSDQLPVYYLGTVGSRVMLYREFRTVTAADASLPARIAASLREMLRDDPIDPDYSGAWPDAATVRDVRIDGSIAVVDLGGVSTNSVGAETAAMTVQQLVWTVTAVAADAGSPVDGVRVLVNGSTRPDLWGHVAIGEVLYRGDALSTQAPVWLISPQQGDAVGRTFQVQLSGAVFEATAQLRVRDASGGVVHEQFVMLSAGAPARGQATVELTLPPGGYTLEAFYFSAMDGSEQAMDDHEITVG